MFVVGVELEVLAQGKEAAGIKSGGSPLRILALVEDLGGNRAPGATS